MTLLCKLLALLTCLSFSAIGQIELRILFTVGGIMSQPPCLVWREGAALWYSQFLNWLCVWEGPGAMLRLGDELILLPEHNPGMFYP